MSDRDDLKGEELAIEQALHQAMATGNEPRLVRGSADAELVREFTEVLGLLAYELPAQEVPERVRKELMGRLPGAAAAPRRDLDDLTLFSPGSSSATDREAAAGEDADAAGHPAVPFPPATPSAGPSWNGFAMAAALAFCLMGFGFLGALVWQQSQQIDRLTSQLVASPAASSGELEALREELNTAHSRLNMVTTVARQAYPLRRVARTASGGQPTGMVYVCGQHQQWYLNLRGLVPPGEEEEYRLWFMTENGKVDGGALEVGPDAHAEREAPTMPPGTHGFLVTLEKQRGPQDEPESLTILLGERPISL